MSRFLLVSEALDPTDAASRLRSVAAALSVAGHETVWAVPGEAPPPGTSGLDTPALPDGARGSLPRAGCLPLLAGCGFFDPETLSARVAAWRETFAAAACDAVIGDRAPAAWLGAPLGLKRLLLGEGVHLPMPGRPLPLAPEDPALLAALGDAARAAGFGFEDPALLFMAERRLVCDLAEFDPLLAARDDETVGPLSVLPAPARPPASGRCIATLDGDWPGLADALAGLRTARRHLDLRVAGLDPGVARFAEQQGMAPHGRHANTAELAAADLVIHHGDRASVELCWALGRPQIAVPRWPEEAARARAAVERGLGVAVLEPAHLDALGAIVRDMLGDPDLGARAYAWALTVAEDFAPERALARVVAAASDLAGAAR